VGVVSSAGIVVVNAFSEHEFDRSKTIAIPDGILTDQEKGEPANFLLIGSDSRAFVGNEAEEEAFGTEEDTGPQHSDTMMILHVEPDAKSGLLVSLPRDLLVEIPGHGSGEMLNAAYAYGGAPLLIETIQTNFNIPIHHYLEVDFKGFANVVSAIGGVKLWFPTAVHDPYTGLEVLEPGCVELSGDQALAYARSRHYYVPRDEQDPAPWTWNPDSERASSGWYATGSDIDRIPRQQYFLRTLSQQAIDNTADNPIRLIGLLDAVIDNFKRDESLTIGQLKALIKTFRGLNPATVQMTTIPNMPAPSNPNRVVVKRPDADPIIQRLQSFAVPQGLPELLAPETVRVRVVNGSGIKGQARASLDQFVAHGFVAAGEPADAERNDYEHTQVRYAPDKSEAGATVAIMLGTTNLVEAATADDALGADVLVIVGRDYDTLDGAISRSPSSTTQVTTSTTTGSGSDVPTSTTTTTVERMTVDTRFVPVDPETGGPLVGCP
jgi:LCP family protein required for cell wall assembly